MSTLEERTSTAEGPTAEEETSAGAALPEPEDQPGLRGRTSGILLAVLGGIAWVAAFVLILEKLQTLRDPNYQPSCSINPVLSCGSIMASDQAEVFGFPNPLIGVAGFAVVITLGVVLAAGVALPRWIWLGLQAGVTFGLGFVCWLVFQSLYRIGALCPYCMVVWAAMIPMFWLVTADNLVKGRIPAGAGVRRVVGMLGGIPVVAGYVAIALLILVRFWSFWVS
ncbi:Vitamin K epoxide reductase [Enemella dayhoffiae]|uniref:Vitamin K epoxide reductase n=1 Tax=Enemella dayhoffiae TaxID=2016507 RepID=A0A255H9M6_9ACTN|nr:vitamin K epoxide reductase family protein [Enemella dayhoffiae]OYO24289.1 Vitamin K epoxide reductase [Enemella dayhoffiae]